VFVHTRVALFKHVVDVGNAWFQQNIDWLQCSWLARCYVDDVPKSLSDVIE